MASARFYSKRIEEKSIEEHKMIFFKIALLTSLLIANPSFAKEDIAMPAQGLRHLEKLDEDCSGCLRNGVILFGNDKSNLVSGKFFDNFFVGSTPKGLMLANAPHGQGYRELLRKKNFKNQAELEKYTKELSQQIRLIVWHKDFREAYFLEPKSVVVNVKPGVFENLKAGATQCEKDICQPTAIIEFQDKDGEHIKLRCFSTWAATIHRKNDDVEKIGSDTRYGSLHFSHDRFLVDLWGRSLEKNSSSNIQ